MVGPCPTMYKRFWDGVTGVMSAHVPFVPCTIRPLAPTIQPVPGPLNYTPYRSDAGALAVKIDVGPAICVTPNAPTAKTS
jgi:hypothetical protein